MQTRTPLMDEGRMATTLSRMAHEIVERFPGAAGLALIGIRTRGETMAIRLAGRLKEITGQAVPLGFLDVTFYRDDFRERFIQPQVKGTDISFSIDGLSLILVDDVLYTGRTVRAAMDELIDFGRPKRVLLAALIDRGHREMPIRPDFVGKNVPTAEGEHVEVLVREKDGKDEVNLVRGA